MNVYYILFDCTFIRLSSHYNSSSTVCLLYNRCSMLCSLESAKAWLPDLLETVEKCEVNGKTHRRNLGESF